MYFWQQIEPQQLDTDPLPTNFFSFVLITNKHNWSQIGPKFTIFSEDFKLTNEKSKSNSH